MRNEQQNEQQLNSRRTAAEQQLNTNKNDKNDKNDKNTTKEISEKKSRPKFEPPGFEEFEAFCREKNFGHVAKQAFDYYSAGEWHDSQGRQVKNWKQKLIAVWFKNGESGNGRGKTNQRDFQRAAGAEWCEDNRAEIDARAAWRRDAEAQLLAEERASGGQGAGDVPNLPPRIA
jgi:hypothetical protein